MNFTLLAHLAGEAGVILRAMASENTVFPKDFVWGAATASYQIEGAWNEGGRGESIWDRYSHTPGNILNNDSGDVATDHYHRWREDIALMKQIGLQAYRFSVAWPRILPTGRGAINQPGLDFYKQLTDALLEAGIQPFVTLYHWDLPQALQDDGGWPVRATAQAFAEYADVVTRALGDQVAAWATFNEPQVSAYVGHYLGRHAPGHQDAAEMLAAAHHLLLAHGLALPAMRANAPVSQHGIVLNLQQHEPASQDPADRQRAWLEDGIQNRLYLDPLAGRDYPQDVLAHFGQPSDYIQAGDMETIAAPIDYLGINHYFRSVERSPESQMPQTHFAGEEVSDMGWEIYPQGMFDILMRVHLDYHFNALYVTENGVALLDREQNGQVHDEGRIAFYRGYIQAARRALQAGAPLKGYFAWSLLDNFEWGFGYSKRFGLVRVNYETQERVLKDSALFYQRVIASNGANLNEA